MNCSKDEKQFKGSPLPCAEESRAELRRILDSPSFEASARNRRFLEYVVETSLTGGAARIKAYNIATDVFGRGGAFDPQLDPIVRIEASRLRRALERFYLIDGTPASVRIDIPKGSYAPTFTRVAPAADVAPHEAEPPVPMISPEPRRRHWRLAAAAAAGLIALVGLLPFGAARGPGDPVAVAPAKLAPAILVRTFEADGDHSAAPRLAEGFTRDIVIALARFDSVLVYGPRETERSIADGATETDPAIDYVLEGSLLLMGERARLMAALIDTRTGRYLWADQMDFDPTAGQFMATRDRLANHIGGALAQPYGVVFRNEAQDAEEISADSFTAYSCVLRFHLYWEHHRADEFEPTRRCLAHAIAAEPGYAEAHAALSLLLSDGHRLRFGGRTNDGSALREALSLAERSIRLAPTSARGHHALALARWLLQDVEGSLDAYRAGIAFNPNDTELMGEFGMRLIARNQPDEGRALIHEALERNPRQPSAIRLSLVLDHFLNVRNAEALAEARRIELPDTIYNDLAVALAAPGLGLRDEPAEAVRRIEALNPGFGRNLDAYFEARNLHPDIIDAIAEGMRAAGMAVEEPLVR